ncbi:MAG TPA: carboxypeptidase regulatory-like domain-containing protein [Acidobacteriaceae bacterium]|nr:carboxypeptidase regulatory-like domain-containing protein [Acidobacteriaceae bacterium]
MPARFFGQVITGSVTGVVKDVTGALVPNATVTLTNGQTRIVRTVASNSAGFFAFSAVEPSINYVIGVSAAQFKSWRSQPFALRPGDQLTIPDIKMAVGSASEQVTVEANSSDVKALDTGERSDVITAKDLQTLPVVGRDATELVRMLPGFDMSTGANGVTNKPGYNTAIVGTSGPTGSFSANGTGLNGISVILDGVSITDIASNAGTVQNLNVDMVQELKVSSSSFGAQNAKGPAIINAVGKSGTAAFHGMGYFYARDASLNANDWYNNYLQQPRPDGRFFYPGGMIGGPVIFPHSNFNRNRDKLFFYVAYEYSNQLYSPETLGSWVPTLAERQGQFDLGSLNAQLCGARPDGKANPDAILPMCQTENFLPNGNEIGDGSVAGLGNPAGVALINWLPQPNANPFTNDDGFNYIKEVLQTQNGSQFHAKLDYNITSGDILSVGYYLQRQISQDPVNYGIPSGSVLYPGDVTNGDISNVMFANYVHDFRPTLTNQFSAAMSLLSSPGNMGNPDAVDRFDLDKYNCSDPSQRAAGTCTAGNGDYDYSGIYKNTGDYSVPALAGNGQLGYPNITMPGGFYANRVRMKKTVPDLADTLTWQKGKHLIQAGFYFEKGILNGLADYGAYPQGALTFNPGNEYFEYSTNPSQNGQGGSIGSTTQFVGCQSSDPAGNERLSGAAYIGACMNPNALMYLGYADSFAQTNFSPTVDMQYTTIAGFVNDTWKFKRLTMDLGIRLEHIGPWSDRHGNGLATFSPTLYSQQCGGSTRNCSSLYMPGVTWHGIDSSISDSVNSPSAILPTPRFGLSWDIRGNGRTVLRGGWGVYRSQEEFNPYAEAAATAQGYKTSVLQNQLSFDSIEDQSPVNPPDFSVYTISSTDSVRPVFLEYNATVDQALPWRSLLEVAYVGSAGRHLDSGYNSAANLNRIPEGTLFNVCPGLGCLPVTVTQSIAPGDIGNLTTPEMDYFRPYPFYTNVYQLKHNFYSSYNSAQIEWRKSTGHVAFDANYTFSKALATGASWNNILADPFNLRNDYNPTPSDRTQVFNINYLIDLGSHYHIGFAPLRKAVNGWQISGISTAQSGEPLASVQGENFGFGYGEIQPVQVQYLNQVNPTTITPECVNTWHIPADANGNHFCVNGLNPVVWLGTPDVQLMPTINCNPAGGPAKHQYINGTCFGIPLPGQNGQLRPPYLRGPAYFQHDLTLLKNFPMAEDRNLQFRLAAFNFLNHPVISFNNNDTNSDLLLSQQFGTAGQPLTKADLTEPGFGVAGIKSGSRLVELSVKYQF